METVATQCYSYVKNGNNRCTDSRQITVNFPFILVKFIVDFRGVSRILFRRRRPSHTILPNFAKNCRKSREFCPFYSQFCWSFIASNLEIRWKIENRLSLCQNDVIFESQQPVKVVFIMKPFSRRNRMCVKQTRCTNRTKISNVDLGKWLAIPE